ncbi:MAG: hypothetical protein U1E92_03175 [Moraxella osloensis]
MSMSVACINKISIDMTQPSWAVTTPQSTARRIPNPAITCP